MQSRIPDEPDPVEIPKGLRRLVCFRQGRLEAAFEDGSGLIVNRRAVTYFRPDGVRRRCDALTYDDFRVHGMRRR